MKLSNSFNSFEIINKNTNLYFDNFIDFKSFYAHSNLIKKPESLDEHINKVIEYAFELFKIHGLEETVHRLINPLIISASDSLQEEFGNFIKEIFWNTFVFHDFGKINENFQIDIMNNKSFSYNQSNKIRSQHSVLSIYLYLAYHLNKLFLNSKFDTPCQRILYVLIFKFSSSIMKHHSSFIDDISEFNSDLIASLESYLYINRQTIDINLINLFFDHSKNKINQYSKEIPNDFDFSLFLLMKLNYSILTASDYYATSSYSSNIDITDFGILNKSDKKILNYNFMNKKNYNRDFFQNRTKIKSILISELIDCNNKNLNILRQKLLDEVIDKYLINKDKNIFYLEAPTGSGKTNLSIALAIKILKTHSKINKVYYVFPFTTLITQTYSTIMEILGITNDKIIPIHSRSGFPINNNENSNKTDYSNYIDYLFLNYPIILMSHIKFFEILKSNNKEVNYILHRFSNSIVIIDELQSYNPTEWDKVAYYIHNFAFSFNIKFIIMSATLPKLDELKVIKSPTNFTSLVSNKNDYFLNPNFKDRVNFDFSLLNKKISIVNLSEFVIQKSELFALSNNGCIKTIIEFIYKKSASDFYQQIYKKAKVLGYNILLISGTILEPRRKEIIKIIKSSTIKKNPKILLVSTQVVEAGVDIDMDLGFKDKSLIDSDEQLAGRVNRNATKKNSQVYIFDFDPAYNIYGNDLRYRITKNNINDEEYKEILNSKNFDYLYDKVCTKINTENDDEFIRNLNDYKHSIKSLNFQKICNDFKLIDQHNITIYVPLLIPKIHFSQNQLEYLQLLKCNINKKSINGEEIWNCYLNLIAQKDDFIKKKISLKKIYSIMSQFMFSIYAFSSTFKELYSYSNPIFYDKYNILYLSQWRDVYNYKNGIIDNKFIHSNFI